MRYSFWRRIINVDMVNVPDGLDFFAYFFVAFIVVVIAIIVIKKIRFNSAMKSENPRISVRKCKVIKKRFYGIKGNRGNIVTYYIDCEDEEGKLFEFRVKEWQFYDIEQGEYIWVIHKYGILSEIGRAEGGRVK